MNTEQAKAIIRKSNPDAVFKEDQHGSFEAFDFTYSDEVRTKVFEYDDIFGALYHSTGEEVNPQSHI